MYIVIILTALMCATALAIQTLRYEGPHDHMRFTAIGGGISVAMILGASVIFALSGLRVVFSALIISLGLLALWTLIFVALLTEKSSR